MTRQLEDTATTLLAWHDLGWTGKPDEHMDKAMCQLWVAVERCGHVLAVRAVRDSPGTARLRGLRAYDQEERNESHGKDDDERDDTGYTQQEHSTAW